jgi:hypothetical protein
MAIPLSSKPNTVAPGGAYPFGDIRDDDGSSNGTPVNTEVYGDFHQFFASLMFAVSATYNGLRENAINGFQYLVALTAYIRLVTASETESGTAPIATQALTNAGVSDATIVTPLKLKNTPEVMGVDGSSKVRTKVLNIGDWNMDANTFTTITHGVTNYQNILSVSVVIRPDSGGPATAHLLNAAESATVVVSGGVGEIEATTFRIWRLTGGIFDSTNYDATSYNRGFVTITYLA